MTHLSKLIDRDVYIYFICLPRRAAAMTDTNTICSQHWIQRDERKTSRRSELIAGHGILMGSPDGVTDTIYAAS